MNPTIIQRFVRRRQKSDYILSLIVFALVIFGLIMISSASVVISYERFGSNYYYVWRQLISFGVGIFVWILTLNIDYRFWQRIAFGIFLGTIILLLLVFLPVIGAPIGGAHRWVHLGSVTFQPSEIVKLAFLIYLAEWLSKRSLKLTDFWRDFIPFLFIVVLIGGLIIFQRDMGTSVVVVLTAITVFFAAGGPVYLLGLIGGLLVVSTTVLIKIEPYRLKRFLVFLNPAKESLGSAYHISQALLGIGVGGWWGLGFGQSRQKYLYLPQAHTDSIFSIIGEELGFLRASLVLILFAALAWRGLRIAQRAPDNFSRLLATGIVSWFVIQAFVNIAAMTGLLPMTGVPLPFISYGGTSLVINLAAVGILGNIAKQSSE